MILAGKRQLCFHSKLPDAARQDIKTTHDNLTVRCEPLERMTRSEDQEAREQVAAVEGDCALICVSLISCVGSSHHDTSLKSKGPSKAQG
jgi:hypothetical protein